MALVHYMSIANKYGLNGSGLARWCKDGRIKTEIRPNAAGIPQFYVDEDDPVLMEVLAAAEKDGDVPDDLVSSRPPAKKKKKKKEPAKVTESYITQDIKSEAKTEMQKAKKKVYNEFGPKSNFKTKIWQIDQVSGRRVYKRTINGTVDVEQLQDMFKEGGDFYLVVHVQTPSGDWEYHPNLSRDVEPISIDPAPGYEPEDAAKKPADDDDDVKWHRRLMRDEVRESIMDRRRRGSDNGKEVGRMFNDTLVTMLGQQNTNFQQMMTHSQQQHERLMETIREERKDREEERKHEIEKIREEAKLRREEDERRAKEREKELDQKAKDREKEADKRHDREMSKLQKETEDRINRDREYFAQLKTNTDTFTAKLKELDDKRIEILEGTMEAEVEAVKETLKTQEKIFEAKEKHLTEMTNMQLSMAPTQVWANALGKVGEKLSDNMDKMFNVAEQRGWIPPAGESGKSDDKKDGKSEKDEGGPKMGWNILNRIKKDPQASTMLRELFEDMAQFIDQDEPAALFAQSILSMVTTQPGFATALQQLYLQPLDRIMDGLVEKGSKTERIMLSEKGQTFWETLKASIREFYNETFKKE